MENRQVTSTFLDQAVENIATCSDNLSKLKNCVYTYKERGPITNQLYLLQISELKMSFENFFLVKTSIMLFKSFLKTVENSA